MFGGEGLIKLAENKFKVICVGWEKNTRN